MADRGVCRGKVLVLGHSFVRRLQTFLGNDQIQLYGHGHVLRDWRGYSGDFKGQIEDDERY